MNIPETDKPEKQILIILRSLRYGGTEKCSLELAQAFIEQGYGVHLALQEPIYDMPHPGKACVHEIGSRDIEKVKSWLTEFHHHQKLSLIIATDTYLPLQLDDIEIYYTLHIVPTERIEGGFFRRLKKRRSWRRRIKGKNIIAISNGVFKDVTKTLRAKPKSIQVIGNTFNFPEIEKLSTSPTPYSLPEHYLLYTGRLTTVKRLDRLLRVYKNSHIDIPLVIMGDGEKYPDIKAMASHMGLAKQVLFAGWQDNPYPAISNANALLLTSDSESFSAILVEALFLKTPVISTDCLGPIEVMGKELESFIIKKEDEHSFSQAIQQVLQQGQVVIKDQLITRYNFKAIIQKFETLMKAD